jgi:hypothetical protein
MTNEVCTHTNAVGDKLTASISDSTAPAPQRGGTVSQRLLKAAHSTNANQPPVLELAAVALQLGDRTYALDADSPQVATRMFRQRRSGEKIRIGAPVPASLRFEGCIDAGSIIRMTLQEALTVLR